MGVSVPLKVKMVVCGFSIGEEIDLDRVVRRLGAKRIMRRKVLVKLEDKKVIILCGSGRGWVSGYKSVSACSRAVLSTLINAGIVPRSLRVFPVNIQVAGEIGRKVNLRRLSEMSPRCRFLPSVTKYPNLQYWLESVKGGFAIISDKGKVSVTGLKSSSDIGKARREIERLLSKALGSRAS